MKYFSLSAIILTLTIFSFGLLFSSSASAQLDTLPGTSPDNSFVPCGYERECTLNDLIGKEGIIQRALNISFVLVGFVGAIIFMYAGFLMMTAAGNPGQITKARGIFKNVTIGIIIILAAVVLVKQLLTYIGARDIFNNIFK